MRILMILVLVFCFGCGDNDEPPPMDAAVETSVEEASVDAQPSADVGEGEAAILDAQSD